VSTREVIGPLNDIEVMAMNGQDNRILRDIAALEQAEKNIQGSLDYTRRKIEQLKSERLQVQVQILRQRGISITCKKVSDKIEGGRVHLILDTTT
jgi:ParB-like chromosome segregation protein Spo0J